jgi:hypothetical protein
MVDLFEEAVDAPSAPPRRASRFGGIALFLALLPGLGLALNAVSPPG